MNVLVHFDNVIKIGKDEKWILRRTFISEIGSCPELEQHCEVGGCQCALGTRNASANQGTYPLTSPAREFDAASLIGCYVSALNAAHIHD